MAWDYCDKCGKRFSRKAMEVVCVCGALWDSPAEYEAYCQRCLNVLRGSQRVKGEDDGVEYGHPADYLAGREE